MRESVNVLLKYPSDKQFENAVRKHVPLDLSFQLVRTVSKNITYTTVEVVVFGEPENVEAFAKKVGI